MFRLPEKTRFLIALATLFLLLGSEADAGLLGKLLRETGDAAGSAGKHVDGVAKHLDEGTSIARKLPKSADSAALALVPAKEGTWQLVTPEGKSLAVPSLEDLPKSLDEAAQARSRPLAGDKMPSGPQKPAKVQVALREADFFKLRDELNGLPKGVAPVLVRRNGSFQPLKPVVIGTRRRLAVELGPNVLIDPATQNALDGNIKFLSRTVNRADLKLARFDSAAAQSVNPAETFVNLNADLLESSLARFKNRTVAVSGQIRPNPETGRRLLVVRDGKKLRQIDLLDFMAAAERQRVDLMIVESTSPVQPGKSWFSKSALEKRFAKMQSAMTQADLLAAVSPPGTTTLIHAADERNYRLVTATSHIRRTAPNSPAAGVSDDTSLAGWLLDAGTRIGVRSVRSDHENPDHTDEVASRWLPWISNVSLILSGVTCAFALFMGWYLWRWWNGLWRRFLGQSGGNDSLSPVLFIVKVLTFVPFALVSAIPALIWLLVSDWMKFLSWPFRKVFGRP